MAVNIGSLGFSKDVPEDDIILDDHILEIGESDYRVKGGRKSTTEKENISGGMWE